MRPCLRPGTSRLTKFLADVNVDRNIVVRLREAGHEVEWLAESATDRRLKDPPLMHHVYDQGQVMLTNDTSFSRHVLSNLKEASSSEDAASFARLQAGGTYFFVKTQNPGPTFHLDMTPDERDHEQTRHVLV